MDTGYKPTEGPTTATPDLLLESYFAGPSRGWGLFEDRFGKVRRQFTVDLLGSWDGKVLVLEEDFAYDDGAIDRRVWRIVKKGPNGYEGHADDIVGVARGVVDRATLHWQYVMNLPIHGRTWRVAFDDWMYLQPDGVLISRARVRKWNVELGQVTVVFQRPQPAT